GARHQRARRSPGGVLIDGVEVTVDREAVVVTAAEPLAVVSSAVIGGGFTSARAVVNLHVPKSLRLEETEAQLAAFADRRRVPVPWVGLLTSAWTEKARVAEAEADGIRALAVVTVGLSHRVASGLDRSGGPGGALGAGVARAAREAPGAGVDRWLEEHR